MEWLAGVWQNVIEVVNRPETQNVLWCGYIVFSYVVVLYANAKSKKKFPWYIVVSSPIVVPAFVIMLVPLALVARAFLAIQYLYSRSIAIIVFALSQFSFVIPSTPQSMPVPVVDSGYLVLSFTHGSQYVVVALFVATALIMRYAKKAGKVINGAVLLINVCAAVGLFLLIMAQTYVSLTSVLFALGSMLVGSIMEDLYAGRPVFTKPTFFGKRKKIGR